MSNCDRFDFQDLEFWKLKEDSNTNEKYYEKVKESGSLFLEETVPLMIDGRICNFEEVTTHQHIRMKRLGNCYVVEPCNLILYSDDMKEITSPKEIVNIDPILFRNISIDTFICDYISAFTRGDRTRISEDEVGALREKFMNREITANNHTTLSPVDFAFMFSLYMYNSGIDSFKKETLMDYIYNIEMECFKDGPNKIEDNAKYKSILGQTKVYRGEHYDVSPDLEFGFACLKYVGLLHPNYDGHDFQKPEEQYEYLGIDDAIMRFASLYGKKMSQFPEMNEFMSNYINLLNEKAERLKLCNGHKNV